MAITTKIERRIHDGGIQALNRAQNDMNEALANITGLGEDTRTDIVNSVLAGNTVTTHSMPINMGDWRGFGYVVFNPQTFSSVYMIDGGPRGGCTGCGDGDTEQAYISFIDTARFAGSDVCWQLIGELILWAVFSTIVLLFMWGTVAAFLATVGSVILFLSILFGAISIISVLMNDKLTLWEKVKLIVVIVCLIALAWFPPTLLMTIVGIVLALLTVLIGYHATVVYIDNNCRMAKTLAAYIKKYKKRSIITCNIININNMLYC